MMNRPYGGYKISSMFFRHLRRRSFNLSTKLVDSFEARLAESLQQLELKQWGGLNLKWMQEAMKVLCDVHKDFKTFVADIQFPPCKWEESWISELLDDTGYLLDICIALNSERSRLENVHLLARYALCLVTSFSEMADADLVRAKSSLEDLLENASGKGVTPDNQKKIKNFPDMIQNMLRSLHRRKKWRMPTKAKALWKVLIGVKATTILVCCAFVSVFLSSGTEIEIEISDHFLWCVSFQNLQDEIKKEMKVWASLENGNSLEEVRRLESAARGLLFLLEKTIAARTVKNPIMKNELDNGREFKHAIEEFQQSSEQLSECLDLYKERVDEFFQITLDSRNALLDGIRAQCDVDIKVKSV